MNTQEISKYINDRMKTEVIQMFNNKACPASIGSFKFDHSEYQDGDLTGFFIDENYPDLTLGLVLRLNYEFYFRTMNIILWNKHFQHRNHHISSTEEFNSDLDNMVNGWVEEYKKTLNG